MSLCKCDSPFVNTGYKNCPTPLTAGVLLFMPIIGSNGLKNSIDTADALYISDRAAYFAKKMNVENPLDRIYPISGLKDVTFTRAESKFKTFSDDSKYFLKKGIRSFSGVVPQGTFALSDSFDSLRCAKNNVGVYIVDISGSLIGSQDGVSTTLLYPIAVSNETIDSVVQSATDSEIQSVKVGFDVEQYVLDSDFAIINTTDLLPARLLSLAKDGLFDVKSTIVSTGPTAMVVKFSIKDAGFGKTEPVRGITAPNFTVGVTPSKIFNATTNMQVTLTAVTVDATGGIYTLTYASQTVGNLLVIHPKMDGFDFSTVYAVQSPVV